MDLIIQDTVFFSSGLPSGDLVVTSLEKNLRYVKWTKQFRRDFYKFWIDERGMDWKKQMSFVKRLKKRMYE